jgi:probable addiction module antidote protein
MIEISDFDVSEYLDTDEKIADYLSSVMADNDWELFLRAIGHIAKAQGMTKVAKDTGLGRESLYKAFTANSQPKFDTVMRVLDSFNIVMQFSPKDNVVQSKSPRPITTRTKRPTKKITKAKVLS